MSACLPAFLSHTDLLTPTQSALGQDQVKGAARGEGTGRVAPVNEHQQHLWHFHFHFHLFHFNFGVTNAIHKTKLKAYYEITVEKKKKKNIMKCFSYRRGLYYSTIWFMEWRKFVSGGDIQRSPLNQKSRELFTLTEHDSCREHVR